MKKAGFTLVELLVSIVIVGMIVGTLFQVAARFLAAHDASRQNQDLILPARLALERMVMFVQESDWIVVPENANPAEALTVSERLTDQYINLTRVYDAAGDGFPDGDNDADGLINEGGADPQDLITFTLDKTEADNWRLMEQAPDYSTGPANDFLPKKVLSEHVHSFSCRRMSAGLVEIALSLRQGNAAVTLKTTARARWVD